MSFRRKDQKASRSSFTVAINWASTPMLVTNFKLKYVVYKIVCAFYQLWDVGRIHPMRERSLRALQRTTDYIERAMPDGVGFEAPAELLAFALEIVKIEGHYLEFGVFTGGTIRFIARKVGDPANPTHRLLDRCPNGADFAPQTLPIKRH
jgi:hypothetical protein